MNQLRKLEKALSLIRPVFASVKARTPKGMRKWEADQLVIELRVASEQLEKAVEEWSKVNGRES